MTQCSPSSIRFFTISGYPFVISAATLTLLAIAILGCTTQVAQAKTFKLAAGDDLQAALDQVDYGDVIELEAGATYEGNFLLRRPSSTEQRPLNDTKWLPGDGKPWIVIRSSAHAKLPPRGTRIHPAYAKLMPKLVTSNASAVIMSEFEANRYQFVGLEITTTASQVHNLAMFGKNGDRGGNATAVDQLPAHIAFERCYIHGHKDGHLVRALGANARSFSVLDCYICEVHARGQDSQAICAWNGTGPFKIVNNYLEAAGENVFFGGGDPSIKGLVPSDIEIRGNYLYKPRRWQKGHKDFEGTAWTVKNLLELKNARRVLIEGNILENSWAHAQAGFAVLFTPRNEEGGSPWAAVEDVTFRKNLVRNTAGGMILRNQDNRPPNGPLTYESENLKRILIQDNIFYNINKTQNGGPSRMFTLAAVRDAQPALQVTIEHNTLIHGDAGSSFIYVGDDGKFGQDFSFRNNITTVGKYGLYGGGAGSPLAAVQKYFNGFRMDGNVLVNLSSINKYPAHNFVAATLADVGFRDMKRGDFQLSNKSPFKNRGTDRANPGADHVAVADALAGVRHGRPKPSPKSP